MYAHKYFMYTCSFSAYILCCKYAFTTVLQRFAYKQQLIYSSCILSSPPHLSLYSGTTFEFQQQMYTVSEDAGTVTLCVTFDGEIPGGQTATIAVATENGNATGNIHIGLHTCKV